MTTTIVRYTTRPEHAAGHPAGARVLVVPPGRRRELRARGHGRHRGRFEPADRHARVRRVPARHRRARARSRRSRRRPSSSGATGPMPEGDGTADAPWVLHTPPGGSEYTAYRDESADPPALVVQVGKTQLRYHLRCIEDLHEMLVTRGDWVPLGNADEQKPAAEGTVEAWARDDGQPRRRLVRARRRASAVASATTCRRCSRPSAWPRSSTTPATTGCARCDRCLAGHRGRPVRSAGRPEPARHRRAAR